MRPSTFGADLSEAWSAWVLDHGLPELPGSNLAVGQSVPVSFWAGPTAGAVIHVRRVFDERHEAPVTETEIDQLLRVEGRWRPEMSSGGSWPDDPPLARIDRKSTRLNSSHANISYAVFCLKKKKKSLEYLKQT